MGHSTAQRLLVVVLRIDLEDREVVAAMLIADHDDTRGKKDLRPGAIERDVERLIVKCRDALMINVVLADAVRG